MFESFAEEEYRAAYADEHINTFIPLQIRTIREQRGWTQGELGRRCGDKAQGWISKLEDPNYGKFTLSTLRALARAFDCMLEVRFRSFKDYSDEQDRRRPGDMRVNTYREDAKQATAVANASLTGNTSTGLMSYVFGELHPAMLKAHLATSTGEAYAAMGGK